MSKRQTQKMLQLMATGQPVEVTSAMSSVKKLARLAHIAQQFGYEYADARQGVGHNGALVILVVPDSSPQARERAARNWAQYPNAADGVSLPPAEPDAIGLLKARINFDLTGRTAEKRMALGALGLTVGMAVGVARAGEGGTPVVIGVWAALMAVLAVGFVITRKRNAKFAARLQAAGFVPMRDADGRVRQLPPGGQLPGHGNPFAGQPGQQPSMPYGASAPGVGAVPPQPNPYQYQPTGPYGQQQPNPYQQPSPYGQAAPYPQQRPHPQQQPNPYQQPTPPPPPPQH